MHLRTDDDVATGLVHVLKVCDQVVRRNIKIGINEAEEMFEKEGNQFITYVPNS